MIVDDKCVSGDLLWPCRFTVPFDGFMTCSPSGRSEWRVVLDHSFEVI